MFSGGSGCCFRYIPPSICPSVYPSVRPSVWHSLDCCFGRTFNPYWSITFLSSIWQSRALVYSPRRQLQSQIPNQRSACLWELSLFSWRMFWETLAPAVGHPKLPAGDEGRIMKWILSFLTPLTLKTQTHVACFLISQNKYPRKTFKELIHCP